MDNFVQTVYQRLLNELSALPELKSLGVKNPLLVGEKVRQCIIELKNHFKESGFPGKQREILFFKYEKPQIVAEHIYTQELYTIEANKPVGDQNQLENYYTRELSFVRRAFDKYRYLYQYYQLDGVEFDEVYFCRGGRQLEITLPVAPDFDPDFSTPGDFLFAKFIAYERLQEYIIQNLYSVSGDGRNSRHTIRWTGDAINLVELIYGLNLTGQLNHGNASLNEIVRWAENQLGVKIGVIQRRFAEIQSRKRIGATKFIDQMRDSVTEKIEKLSA
jgi:hypothetical protein